MNALLWVMAAILGIGFVLSLFVDFGPWGIALVGLALAALLLDGVMRRRKR
jgi:threonine/homoserine efflux transporter RhtA